MAFPLSEATGGTLAAAGTDQALRFFTSTPRPDGTSSESWEVCAPEAMSSIPAVPYFFARDLRASRQIPLGIINCSTSGDAPITSWMSTAACRGVAKPVGPRDASIFNGMIAPLLPYPITGVLWYQGESDEGEGALLYRVLLQRLIRDWRVRWKQGPFPFLMVSEAGFGSEDGPAVEPLLSRDGTPRRAWPWLREAVSSALTLPSTGMAVATDLGIPDDRHPPDKLDVGRRLALLARHRVYGEAVSDCGPVLRDMRIDGNKVRLRFESGGGGLTVGVSPARVGEANGIGASIATSLRGFSVAGKERKWFPATARIEEDQVILFSDAVPNPEAVRYNWRSFPVGNLYNKEGLPAAPFRTDTDQAK